ncbi:TetR/AcrR family transcriptional regulator [Kitasatospora sp. DSM 101779]|uniref:TetR/AcrR family transcriptional regulator n=1 Tax=Kitasatospora sp. DSM 101779 TaxID=2853165 RepID=UPI0021DAF29D|nr:TetR/AcrR family transcriptional regulator C-terminal domain-containing protein [Kitasatospora sp. DSM 101779]MCU7820713.1 TetR/AcrR family transcriptional regulator C-terminal domain-containing protein [Kitasatospora sp. DSM 101779]
MDRTDGARYRRIVDELRARIEQGELAPGDRVPSTREITRQWGVAMATATKALTELRRTGLVRAVPGVGTVVAAPEPPTSATPPPGPVKAPVRAAAPEPRGGQDPALTAERIVTAATAVADAEGLAALSMRRVAAELGVATMSLYRHVADKDDLLVRMMDAAFVRWTFPDERPDGWREPLALAARMLWDTFRRHPWLAPALSMTRPQVVASALPLTEWVLDALDGRGLDPWTAFTTHLTLFNYVRGTAINVEAESTAMADSGLDAEEWMATQEPALLALMATGRFPMLERHVTGGYDFDLDRLFEFGLQRILDGIAVLIDGPAAGGPAAG